MNGRIQFVGSDEAQLRKTIEEELKNPPGSPIEARAIIEPAGEINVSYQVRPHHEELLQVALIQLHAKSHVLKGENQGRLLEHVDLVRDFRTIKVDPGKTNQGSLILALPQGLTSADCRIIAFLQEKQSRHIIGAVEIPL